MGFGVYQDNSGTRPTDAAGSPALQVSDYDKAQYSLVGSLSDAQKASAGDNTYVEITLPVASINRTGWTKVMIRSAEWAAGRYYAHTNIHSADGANKPYLDIDYAATAIPSFPKVNKDDAWIAPLNILVNVGDEWIPYADLDVNIGDSWVEPI